MRNKALNHSRNSSTILICCITVCKSFYKINSAQQKRNEYYIFLTFFLFCIEPHVHKQKMHEKDMHVIFIDGIRELCFDRKSFSQFCKNGFQIEDAEPLLTYGYDCHGGNSGDT